MKAFKKFTLLVLAAMLCVATLIPTVSVGAVSALDQGKNYGVKEYLADLKKSPVWHDDSIGEADRLAQGSTGQLLPTKFADAPNPEFGTFVNESGPKDVYTGYQSTSYWKTAPTEKGYYNIRFLQNADRGRIIQDGGMVWEFDLFVENDGLSTTGVRFDFYTTGSASGGSNTRVRMARNADGKICMYYSSTTNASAAFDMGKWVHITMAFDASDTSNCVLYTYVSEAGNPNAERKLAFKAGLGKSKDSTVLPTTVRIHHIDTDGKGAYRIDNMIVYGGCAIRNPYKISLMNDTEKFVYFSSATADTTLDAATRLTTYDMAFELLNTAKESSDANVIAAVDEFEEFLNGEGLAELKNIAKSENAAEYKRLAEKAAALGIDGETRSITNISSREIAIKAAEDYLISLAGFIAENDDFKEAKSIISNVSAKIKDDLTVKSFISDINKFYLNYEKGFVSSMRGYYEAAAEVYEILPPPEVYLPGDSYTVKYEEALAKYQELESILNILEMQANSTRVCQIVELLEASRDKWATDPKYKRMWNVAFEILEITAHYDPDYENVSDYIERFYAEGGPHEYFWGQIQREHIEILKAKLDKFNNDKTSYIEKAGICTFVDYYIKDNEKFIDSDNYEVFELVNLANTYKEKLGALEDEYRIVIAENTEKFVNTLNIMLETENYAELRALYDVAEEYYYAMGIPDDETMEKVLAFEAIEERLIEIESDCLLFIKIADEISFAANDDQLYNTLVIGYGCYDNLDDSFEGVVEAKEVYSASYDAYMEKVETVNCELSEVVDVTCSVRSFFGLDALVGFIRSLFDF